ncbi:MAG: hypothetical protein ABJ327_21245 [Litoreibacter sp.]
MNSQETFLLNEVRPDPNAGVGAVNLSEVFVPPFVTITETTRAGNFVTEFVICNEATGKYFAANQATIKFFTALKDTGQLTIALARAGIPSDQGEQLIKSLLIAGVLSKAGETQTSGPIKAPIEGKAMSIRLDLVDSGPIVEKMAWAGRIFFSAFGYFSWFLAMLLTLFQLLAHQDKVWLSLQQVFEVSWLQWGILSILYLSLKVVHEMGHGLAYAEMCRKEGLEPGPIRMGISTFAFTPFPFTDVTGAWRLRSKWRRMMIGAGGIYFETWAIAILTLFWAQTENGMLQTIVLQIAVIAGILTLAFNLNPAVKLDGYFILTDFLRQPNLAGRASRSARNLTVRVLGGKAPRPVKSEIAYWILSYLYRWTIFAGVFWMSYQFDKRIAPFALAVVVVTLLIRPLARTLRFAYKAGMKPIRATTVGILFAALAGLSLVPFADRILIPGQYLAFESRFVEVAESGVLQTPTKYEGFVITAPQLEQQIIDTALRTIMMQNLERASLNAPQEKAQLANEIAGFTQTSQELSQRKTSLSLSAAGNQIWTDINADALQSTWVTPSQTGVLGALSTPIKPYFRLRLDQRQLENGLTFKSNSEIRIRYAHAPECEVSATISTNYQQAQIQGEILYFKAFPSNEDNNCTRPLRNGGAVIARMPTNPRSIVERVRFGVSRILQSRLPINNG